MRKQLFTLLCGLCVSLLTSAQVPTNISESNPLDLTGMVANASCENAPGWQHHSNEQAGTSGSHYAKNVALFNSSDYTGTGIESWTAKPVTSRDIIFQDLFLPAGEYVLEACVVAQVYVSDTQSGRNNGGISLFLGDNETECTSNKWQRLSVKLKTDKEGSVRIGVRANSTNKNTWIGLADVHLKMTSIGDITSAISLDENYDTYVVSKDIFSNVYLHKYLPQDRYVALCLPVAISEDVASTLFQSIASIKTAKLEDGKITFTTQTENSVEAGKVYLVKAKKTVDELICLGVSLITSTMPEPVKIGNLTLHGTYRVHEHTTGSYILNYEGTAFVPATGRAHIKGFGAFIK